MNSSLLRGAAIAPSMRAGLYMLRARYQDPKIMVPIDLLRLHTLGSAQLMGLADKVGSLEVGRFADFIVIAPATPVFDAAATVVFATTSENLEAVYVGGEKLVDHLTATRADWANVVAEVDNRVARIRQQAQQR